MSGQRLSFNREQRGAGHFSIPGYSDQESDEVLAALRRPMPLRSKWTLWLQGGGTYTLHKVITFGTAQEFWSVWNGLPQPSELLDNKKFSKVEKNGPDMPVDGLMIFRENIKPEWEDQANAKGGHLTIPVKISFGGPQIDEWWNNLILGVVGETMDCCHRITGVRLLDKIVTKSKEPPQIRLEVWYHSNTHYDEVDRIKRSLEACLHTALDGTVGLAPCRKENFVDKKH